MTESPVASDPDRDPTDPYTRRAQILPRLSEEMAERIARYGAEEWLPAGTLAFQRHQRGVDFFLILEGKLEIFEADEHGKPNVITALGQRQFTGELDLFNDRESLVSARTSAECRVIRVKRADFRSLVSSETDIGEILMRAFILRRTGFILHRQGGVVLVGPGHDGDTLRLQRFLTRNGYPHRLLDTDNDPDAASFLQCLDIRRDQLPVVLFPGEQLLRNPSILDLADHLGLTERLDERKVWDVAVVGAGPAGLAAAVYAASEGLATIVIESSGARRAGGYIIKNRELPWLSDGYLRSGAGWSRANPGTKIRGEAGDFPRGDRCRLWDHSLQAAA